MKIYRNHFFVQVLIPMISLSLIPSLILTLLLTTVFSSYQFSYVRQESERTSAQIAAAVEALLDGYHDILLSLSNNAAVQQAVAGETSQSSIVRSSIAEHMFQMKGKIEIHVISFAEDELRFSSGSIPHLYRYKVYRAWDNSIFHKIEQNPHMTIMHPTHYSLNASGDSIALSLGKAIVQQGETMGCVILDIYRSELYSIIKSYQILDAQQVMLFTADKRVLLDTANIYREGLVDRSIQAYAFDRRSPITNQTEEMTTTICTAEKYGISVLNQCGTLMQMYAKQEMRTVAAVILLFTIPLCTLLSWIIAKKQTRPIMEIKRAMERVATGNWNIQLHLNRQDEMHVLEDGFNSMVRQLKQYTQERVEQESSLKEAQMRALQAQINPHFLMNTLASIRALARKHGIADIQTIADDLSALFAYNVYGSSSMITLSEDIEIIQKYVAIQNVRFDNKFSLEIHIPQELMGICLPPLILQTLVENAIIHGLEYKLGPGIIRINAAEETNDFVLISVWDNGVGMDEDALQRLNEETSPNVPKHIGLRNARHRIALCFGAESRLWVESKKHEYTAVKILIRKTSMEELPNV